MTAEQQEAVNEILRNTDWDKFWADVLEKSIPEIEAYERAYVRSKADAMNHWLL